MNTIEHQTGSRLRTFILECTEALTTTFIPSNTHVTLLELHVGQYGDYVYHIHTDHRRGMYHIERVTVDDSTLDCGMNFGTKRSISFYYSRSESTNVYVGFEPISTEEEYFQSLTVNDCFGLELEDFINLNTLMKDVHERFE